MGAIQNSINGAIQSIQSVASRIVGGKALKAYTDETTKKNELTEAETKALQEQAAKDKAEKEETEKRIKGLTNDFTKYSQMQLKPTYDANQMFNGLTYTLNNKIAGRVQRDSIHSNINAAKQRKESKVTATRSKVGGRK